ncbi:MAG: multidrug transporter [Fibrobacter sp.]|nr:multidrug transporter [Fibrobacter sp.]
MGIVNKSIAEISQPEELLDFISENGIAITMTDKEAEMLLGYMEGHDYVIGFAGGDLYRGDLDEIPGEIVWDEYSVDDLIDSVCEWNYELILDMDAARQNPADMVDFSNKQSKYESLKQEEAVLDKLFDQTKYRAGIDKLAEELANQFIANLNKNGVEHSVNTLVSEIRQPAMGGRSR